jgi:hypothetical protein
VVVETNRRKKRNPRVLDLELGREFACVRQCVQEADPSGVHQHRRGGAGGTFATSSHYTSVGVVLPQFFILYERICIDQVGSSPVSMMILGARGLRSAVATKVRVFPTSF